MKQYSGSILEAATAEKCKTDYREAENNARENANKRENERLRVLSETSSWRKEQEEKSYNESLLEREKLKLLSKEINDFINGRLSRGKTSETGLTVEQRRAEADLKSAKRNYDICFILGFMYWLQYRRELNSPRKD